MGRKPCCSKEGLKKGAWTKKEDLLLTEYIKQYGEGTGWRSLPKKAGKEISNGVKFTYTLYILYLTMKLCWVS